MALQNVVMLQSRAGVLVDLEALVEFQQVEQLSDSAQPTVRRFHSAPSREAKAQRTCPKSLPSEMRSSLESRERTTTCLSTIRAK